MNKAKSALLNIFYYDNHVVESLVSIIQMVVIPMYWTRSFGESPSWMMLSLITSGIISMYGSISGKLVWRRAGSILSLIFSACLMISCHRINCEAEVAAAMITILCLWNYIRIRFESSIRFFAHRPGDSNE